MLAYSIYKNRYQKTNRYKSILTRYEILTLSILSFLSDLSIVIGIKYRCVRHAMRREGLIVLLTDCVLRNYSEHWNLESSTYVFQSGPLFYFVYVLQDFNNLKLISTLIYHYWNFWINNNMKQVLDEIKILQKKF